VYLIATFINLDFAPIFLTWPFASKGITLSEIKSMKDLSDAQSGKHIGVSSGAFTNTWGSPEISPSPFPPVLLSVTGIGDVMPSSSNGGMVVGGVVICGGRVVTVTGGHPSHMVTVCGAAVVKVVKFLNQSKTISINSELASGGTEH
jgi:hypothetical protein